MLSNRIAVEVKLVAHPVGKRRVGWFYAMSIVLIWRWLFSMLLALLSGYGYRVWHILAVYALVISLFAIAYFVLGL